MFVLLLASHAQAMPVISLPGGIDAFAVSFDGVTPTHALASSIAEDAGETLIGYSACEQGADNHAINGCLVLLTEDSAGGTNYRRVTDTHCSGLTAMPCYGGYTPRFHADIALASGGPEHLATGDLRAYTPLGSALVGSYTLRTDPRAGRVQLEVQDVHGGPLWLSSSTIDLVTCGDAFTEELCEDVRVAFLDTLDALTGSAYAWASATPSVPTTDPVVRWDPPAHAAALRDLFERVAVLASDELYDECLSDPTILDAQCEEGTSDSSDQGGDPGGTTQDQCEDVGAVCFESQPPHIEERTGKDGGTIRECVQSYCVGEIDSNCNCSNDECATITVPDSSCE